MKLPPHVKGYISNGRQYYYFRGTKVQLPGLPWSPEFMEVHARMMATREAPAPVVIGATRTQAGSVNAGLVAYYLSGRFTHDLGDGTLVGAGLVEDLDPATAVLGIIAAAIQADDLRAPQAPGKAEQQHRTVP